MLSLVPAKASRVQATPSLQATAVAVEASEVDKDMLRKLAPDTKDAIASTWRS